MVKLFHIAQINRSDYYVHKAIRAKTQFLSVTSDLPIINGNNVPPLLSLQNPNFVNDQITYVEKSP